MISERSLEHFNARVEAGLAKMEQKLDHFRNTPAGHKMEQLGEKTKKWVESPKTQ